MKKKPVLGIIGGSGLYDLPGLKNSKLLEVNTPFGKTSSKILSASYKKLSIFFLPRHGKKHQIAPTNINYKANIFALKKVGVTDIISVSAVGSLKNKHKPGDFILVDQFIDRTTSRSSSFFDNNCVVHVSMARPVSEQLCKKIYQAKKKYMSIKKGGIYLAIEGPQFSTFAESQLYRSWGCDVIGMTNLPEARLAREAELGYSSICMITDYDCWKASHDDVTVEQIISVMNKNVNNVKVLLTSLFDSLDVFENWDWKSPEYSCLDGSIVTGKENIPKSFIKKLNPIFRRYLSKN